MLGASKYHWVNYDDEKMKAVYLSSMAQKRGTELHELAHRCIELKQKLPRSKNQLNAFVNDAIDMKMASEQVLLYSEYCFGTADAISFDKNTLHIHDLKTGEIPGHMEQLEIYAALFCLEYGYAPENIRTELRIYQSGEVSVMRPDPQIIRDIMDKIVQFDKIICGVNNEGEAL